MEDKYVVNPYNKQVESQYPNSVFYQIFLQSFYDSNNDNIGDINGLIEKLDYLEELGIEAIWLLPIHPSMSYHKYDITDYRNINSTYGDIDDFRNLVSELHKRNIKIIIDLVVNHTGSDHPWFEEAIHNPESKYKDYYVWSDDKSLISKAKHQWHSDTNKGGKNAPQKYYGFFWHEMPDLNYNNTDVRKEVLDIGKFWLDEIGIDGFRLDAVRFFYPEGEEQKNYDWWKEFHTEMNLINSNYFSVGEIWGKDTIIAPFLEKGIHAGFNFDLSYSIIDAVKTGRHNNLVHKLIETHELYSKYNQSFVDATFLTNHDQNRIMSELKGVKYKARLAASILFTLPGSPFIYYGEELGMTGKKPDEFIREPFLWSNTDTVGYCKWIDPRYNLMDSISSLEEQRKDPKSLFNHYRRLIELRKSSKALRQGNIIPVKSDTENIMIFKRELGNEKLLIVTNLKNINTEIDFSDFSKEYNRLIYSSRGDISKGDKITITAGMTLVFSNLTD